MGAKNLEISPNWRSAGKLLSVDEVCAITKFSYQSILELRKQRILCASLDKRPYRFDPEHIYQVFFGAKKSGPSEPVSSLKTEGSEKFSHKPIEREELWQE